MMNTKALRATSIGFLLMVSPLAGCNRVHEVAKPSATPETQQINEVIEAPIRSLGQNRASVVGKLGQPSDLAVADVTNRHEPGRMDKIHTMNFEGITVQVYEVVAHKKELLLSVRMGTNRPGLLPEIVGKDEEAIRAMLGLPFQTRGQEWDYKAKYESEPGEDVMTLKFGRGHVASVEWNFYLD